MKFVHRGKGKPLLLIHGLGGSWRSWGPILGDLAAEREVIAVDLPGFGASAPLPGRTTIGTLADAVTDFMLMNGLLGVDAVGSSMGARLVVELARRGVMGSVVALDPGGFWRGWERHAFYHSIDVSIRLVRALQPAMPFIAKHALTRSLLLAQLSADAAQLSPPLVLAEMRTCAASPVFDELLYELAFGESQRGALRGSIVHPLVIGWGRCDRVCYPRQAKRALALFPDARLHWFDDAGHFPHWDSPDETVKLILDSTGPQLSNASRKRLEDATNLARRASEPTRDLGLARRILR
jgi:pimeloyl-ACP methyl ester carboxylesterase